MHDEISDWAKDLRSTAIDQVDDFFAGLTGAGRLPNFVLDRYRKHVYKLGWRIPVDFSDGVRVLHVLADGEFPYTPLRVAVADPPDVLTWPHLESEGLLCVLPPDTAVSSANPAEVAVYITG